MHSPIVHYIPQLHTGMINRWFTSSDSYFETGVADVVCSRTGRMQRRRERMMLDFHPILTFFVPSSHSGWIILCSMMPVMNWSGIQGMLFIRSTYQRACERKRALLRILCLFHNYIAARRYKRQQPKVLRSSRDITLDDKFYLFQK